MTDLDARITFLQDEIKKCKDMSSAASNLSGALSRIGEKFTSCSESLSAGGFTVDGTGADTYTFGGYNQYVTTNITPIVNELDSLCSTLNPAILKYDKELTDLISERDRLRRLDDQEDEEKSERKIPLTRILIE
jgi:hypothetical protein